MSYPFTGARLIVLCVLVPGSSAPTANAQSGASFQGIGALSGHTNSEANAVSGDGSTVVGSSFVFSDHGQATRWTQTSGLVGLGFVSAPSNDTEATAASFDGSVIVGNGSDGHFIVFRWTDVGGMQGLAFGGDDEGPRVQGISDAGDVIVGSRSNRDENNEALRYTIGGGVQLLGGLGGNHTAAMGIAGNGAVIVGVASGGSGQGFRWSEALGIVGLGFGPTGFGTWAYDASLDGSVIVGQVNTSIFGEHEAMRWTAATEVVSLGDLPGGDVRGRARAVSADGSVVVGDGHSTEGQRAFIWTQAHDIRDLKTVLTNDFGLNLAGWTLMAARGISADGRVIVGEGINPQGLSEGWVAVLSGPDTDGDGLLDDWETNGIPYTDSFGAEQRYVLSFDGDITPDCDVNRKDIFVEVDAMTGFAPTEGNFNSVKAAFNTAPVTNPNGAANGIKLHISLDETNIPAGDWTQDDTNGNGETDWPTEFDALKLSASSGTTLTGYFGTHIERNDPDAGGLREARAKAFRYCIFGRSMDAIDTSTGPSGIAEIGGNDFIVTLGLWSDSGSPAVRAGTFMHELGHTLGLRHGGGDDINFKPNYYSVMNYAYQMPTIWMSTNTWPLEPGRPGYSTFALPTLNESALNECAAQVTPGSLLAGTVFISSFVDDNNFVNEWFGRYDVATDWNNSGGDCRDPIGVDLNRLPIVAGQSAPDPSPDEVLIGHDDWAALDLNFLDSPAFAAGVHNTALGEGAVREITFEEHQSLNDALPPFCQGDVLNDGSVNVADLLAVITSWGGCPQGCLADIAPIAAADGQVNVADLLLVITSWGPCP